MMVLVVFNDRRRGVVMGGGVERGGRIVAASEMLRPSVGACSASGRDVPRLQKVG